MLGVTSVSLLLEACTNMQTRNLVIVLHGEKQENLLYRMLISVGL